MQTRFFYSGIFVVFSHILMGLTCSFAFAADNLWDLRSIASNKAASVNLYRADKTLYSNVKVSDVITIRNIVDRYSLESGIYPVLNLRESNEINAMAGFINGSPTIIINKPMFDIIRGDAGIASALLGHEIAHLYLRHGESSATNQAIGNLIAMVAGITLEILAQRKLGITDLGMNLGAAIGTLYAASFSREQEREADKQGLEWAIKSGYDPNGAVRLFEALESKAGNKFFTFFQTHPNPGERVQNAKELIASHGRFSGESISPSPSPQLLALNESIKVSELERVPNSKEGQRALTSFLNQDYVGSKREFEICAKNGEAICASYLGYFYQFGLVVPKDRIRALAYFVEASKNGLAFADYSIVATSVTGEIPPDKFFQLLNNSANAGSPHAMGMLAYLSQMNLGEGAKSYFPSSDVLANYAQASAMRGIPDGLLGLGMLYKSGVGVNKSIDLAENYFILASQKHMQFANAELYLIYQRDKVNHIKAKKYADKIVANHEIAAITAIAKIYCVSSEMVKSPQKCHEWSKVGAENGDPFLASIYGFLLMMGISLDKDLIEGGAWVAYASSKGIEPIGATRKLLTELSPDNSERVKQRVLILQNQFSAK